MKKSIKTLPPAQAHLISGGNCRPSGKTYPICDNARPSNPPTWVSGALRGAIAGARGGWVGAGLGAVGGTIAGGGLNRRP
jgi:hypothetical protein